MNLRGRLRDGIRLDQPDGSGPGEVQEEGIINGSPDPPRTYSINLRQSWP